MEFPEETPAAPKPITVKQLVYRLRDTVSIAVGTQWVVGELSNVKHHTSGHVYFTLKEQGAEIFCAFFKAAASKCPIRLQEGMKVHVLGSATVYPDRGQLQLVIRQVKAAGQGDLQTRFLELKAKLQREGLFDAEHKKKIPTFPRAIGIVTSPTGAVIQDIRHVLERRAPWVKAYLLPVRVQGAGAEHEIAAAVRAWSGAPFNGLPPVDVLIVGRGGGSIEDLWAFNEEETARAIFSCNTPVISAVGHETDTTIADYVADLRAPTPSAAAELAVADISALQGELYRQKSRLFEAVTRKVQDKRDELARREKILSLLGPQEKLQDQKMRLARAQEDLAEAMQQKLALSRQEMEYDRQRLQVLMREKYRDSRHRMQIYIEKLKGLSPLEKLGQGYSYTADVHGRKITQTGQVKKGDTICVYVSDGRMQAKVTDIQKDKQDAGEV